MLESEHKYSSEDPILGSVLWWLGEMLISLAWMKQNYKYNKLKVISEAKGTKVPLGRGNARNHLDYYYKLCKWTKFMNSLNKYTIVNCANPPLVWYY